MVEDSYLYMKPGRQDTVVLVAGDGDFIPPVRSVQRRGVRVRVVFWTHATSRELREIANEFIALDLHFDQLTRSAGTVAAQSEAST